VAALLALGVCLALSTSGALQCAVQQRFFSSSSSGTVALE